MRENSFKEVFYKENNYLHLATLRHIYFHLKKKKIIPFQFELENWCSVV